MRKVHLLHLLLPAALLLAGCDKIDFGDDSITQTNAQGQQTGAVDDSDWTTDASWSKREAELFPDLPFSFAGPTSPRIAAPQFLLYPNPAPKHVVFAVALFPGATESIRARVHFAIVDRAYRVQQRGTLYAENSLYSSLPGYTLRLGLALDQDKLKKGKTYRMYYVLADQHPDAASPSFLAKGHGDIKISR
ncbi:hypothetical protein EJV47_14350 [Hymenobacter gummosus]|uniref:Lipoprotein n=1 Tax=Hymenobacter gummosus TaxID=1776032 RepID=A0A431U277_9BACT|nr:hypothetical protein [Hymenobacter gummosus]RTQ49318.1 hypothetical protein EJV47_14350 [Hymenobacter gummosus]